MSEKTLSLFARVSRELGIDQHHCTTECCSIVLGKKTSLHHRYINQSVIPEVQLVLVADRTNTDGYFIQVSPN